MTTRFERYFDAQMEDPTMRELVEQELTSLQIGTQIAKLRAKRSLNQTQLAARARMSAPKVSKIESKPTNVQLDTLIRIASALGAHVEINIVEGEGRLKPKPVPKRRAVATAVRITKIRATRVKVIAPATRLSRARS
jgi:transcriptional regulator with XRE-family HTH domain